MEEKNNQKGTFYDKYPTREKWLEAVKKHLYYSEDFGREMLELSDMHILWRIYNHKYEEEMYNILVENAINEMEEKYDTEFYLLGRSGRHVCVENSERNRKRYERMVKDVEIKQREIIEIINNN